MDRQLVGRCRRGKMKNPYLTKLMFTSAGILHARCRHGVEGGRWRRGKMKKSILHKINSYICRELANSMSIWSKRERLGGNTKKSTPIKNHFYIRRPTAAATWVRLCAGNGKKCYCMRVPSTCRWRLTSACCVLANCICRRFWIEESQKKTRY